MPRFGFSVFFVGTFCVFLVLPSSPQEHSGKQHFWNGLEKFAEAAENQMVNKPIPDINQWRSQRIQTITKLKELRDKLDTVCFYSSCGKIVGIGMNILCILSNLVAAITSFIGATFSLPVWSFSGIICPSGLLTKEASSIMNNILSKKYQNELQAVLLKDIEVSKSLDEWLNSSPNLEVEFQNIFGFDIRASKGMEIDWFSEFCKVLTHVKNFKKALEHMKRGKYSSFLNESIGIEELRQFSERILNSPYFSNKIQQSLRIIKAFVGTIHYTKSLTNVYRNIRGEAMHSTISFLQDKLNIKIPFLKLRLSAFILLSVLDLAKEVTSLIDETKVIKDGKCPYSDSLKHITDMLQQELKLVESSFPV